MIIGLYVRSYDWMTGREYREPVTSERCWKCGTERPDIAHAVHEYVAAILGAEVQRRVDAELAQHTAEHGCERWPHFGCPAVDALWDLLPDYMKPVAIA